MQLFKLGALLALAQSISAAEITLMNTSPPALPDEHACTLIIHNPINGCKGSSHPWSQICGRNDGSASTKAISGCSNNAHVTVDWFTGVVHFSDDAGGKAMCVLSGVHDGGHCNTNHPHTFDRGNYNAANTLVTPNNALYALGSVIAAGMYL